MTLRAPVAYDPAWPGAFAALADRLRAAGAPDDWQIAHIGSTAVPGLMAKPIIDIQIGLPALARLDWAPIRAAGFAPAPEIDRDDPLPGTGHAPHHWHKAYARLIEGGLRRAHLHIREIGRANHRLALVMRDHLRASPASAALYAEMKRQAVRGDAALGALSDPCGTGAYGEIKDPFVRLLALHATDWAGRTGWQPPQD